MKRKILSLFLVIFSLFCLVACDKENNTGALSCEVVLEESTRVVISVSDKDGSFTVLDCMELLQEKGEISYKISSGMITEINGKENTADFSSCWMLYTSDTEMSNADWGTIDCDGKTLASAIVGADTLTVISGGVYVWEYQTF